MWIWLTLASAFLLGIYDIAKKQAVKKNSVLYVLLFATGFSTLLLSPFLSAGSLSDHLYLLLKAALVTASWISGLIGIKLLPITTSSTIKASRPVFVLVFSITLFGERLNFLQLAGIIVAILALYMLSRSSKKEGIEFKHNTGFTCMCISVLTGSASALYDKHIMSSLGMEPLFVQSWCNLYITILLGLTVLVWDVLLKKGTQKFKWDWMLVLIAVMITCADYFYFLALSKEGALLSVISMVRRCSVIVTFSGGALIFKEHNIRDKAIDLAVLLGAMALIVIGTA